MVREIETWLDLLQALRQIETNHPDWLQQPIQCAPPEPDHSIPVGLLPGFAIGTVEGFELPGTRSTVDNKYHADELVLLIDHNPFAEDGVVAYNWDGPEDVPIYGKDGPTPLEQQMAPAKAEIPKSSILSAISRSKHYERNAE